MVDRCWERVWRVGERRDGGRWREVDGERGSELDGRERLMGGEGQRGDAGDMDGIGQLILTWIHNSISYKNGSPRSNKANLTDLPQSSFHRFAVSPSHFRLHCQLLPETGTYIAYTRVIDNLLPSLLPSCKAHRNV